MNDPLFSIDGVEIFAVGTWNGEKYTLRDLQDIVDAYDKVGFKPPLKAGHDEKSGEPALGWIQNLRIVGNKLVADFKDISQKVYETIKGRGWDTVSAEIFWNLDRNGKVFRRVLKAVALLGIEIPAVADLKPLRDVAFSGENATVKYHDLNKEESEMDEKLKELTALVESLKTQLAEQKTFSQNAISEQTKTLQAKLSETEKKLSDMQTESQKKIFEMQEAGRRDRIAAKVKGIKIPAFRKFFQHIYESATASDAKVVKFAQKDGEAEKDTPLVEVVDGLVSMINQKAERLFGETGNSPVTREEGETDYSEDPGAEVDRRAKEFMTKNKEKDYKVAQHAVLDADPELKQAYAEAK